MQEVFANEAGSYMSESNSQAGQTIAPRSHMSKNLSDSQSGDSEDVPSTFKRQSTRRREKQAQHGMEAI